MKRYAIIALASALLTVQAPAHAAASLRVFDGNDCSGSGGNCLDDVVVTPSKIADFQKFEVAVKGGKTIEYFTADSWKALFPQLSEFPERLKALRGGTPFVRLNKPNGKVYFVATKLSEAEVSRLIAAKRVDELNKNVIVCVPVVQGRRQLTK